MSPDAAYFREWRAKNPQYRKRQNELRNARRREKGREDRKAEYAKRASRAAQPIPPLFTGHEIFEAARKIVDRQIKMNPGSLLVFRSEQIWEEAMGDAVLAIVERRMGKRSPRRKAVDVSEEVTVASTVRWIILRERTYDSRHVKLYETDGNEEDAA